MKLWGILSIFCIQNVVKLKKYTRKYKIAIQIFALRAYEHVRSKYIPIRDRQRFGTTSGLRYFTKIRTDNAHQRSSTLTAQNGLATKMKVHCANTTSGQKCQSCNSQPARSFISAHVYLNAIQIDRSCFDCYIMLRLEG